MITPLVSLLTDQLQHLAEAGIESASLSGSASWEDQRRVYNDLRSDDPAIRILFLTPEKVQNFVHLECACQRPSSERAHVACVYVGRSRPSLTVLSVSVSCCR